MAQLLANIAKREARQLPAISHCDAALFYYCASALHLGLGQTQPAWPSNSVGPIQVIYMTIVSLSTIYGNHPIKNLIAARVTKEAFRVPSWVKGNGIQTSAVS